MAPDRLSYDDLLSRLADAEEQIRSLIDAETDAIISARGVHVLRLHETDRALQAAKSGLEEMLAARTEQLRLSNENLLQEVIERKQIEEALRKSQEKLRRLYESRMMGAFYWTFDGRITDANDAFLEMIGYTRQELEVGKIRWDALSPPEYRVSDQQTHSRLKATGVDSPYHKDYIRKDGVRIPVVISSAMLSEDGDGGISVVLDMTERKRAEQALIRSEKLASVGRMAATVAHEINNPLELVLNAVYIASLDKNLSEQARTSLATAEQELNRVAQLTRQTLGFYRENTAPSEVDLSKLVSEVIELYRPKLLQRNIKVEAEHQADLHARVIAGEIRQVVSNIITNAIDASPRGGKIRIRTNSVRLNGNGWVRMSFADVGEGIPRENLNHIFEPFFTTKEAVGTGLGLWVTGDIVRRHRGKLRVRSRPGRGTVFSVMLPAASNQSSCEEDVTFAGADSSRRR